MRKLYLNILTFIWKWKYKLKWKLFAIQSFIELMILVLRCSRQYRIWDKRKGEKYIQIIFFNL